MKVLISYGNWLNDANNIKGYNTIIDNCENSSRDFIYLFYILKVELLHFELD